MSPVECQGGLVCLKRADADAWAAWTTAAMEWQDAVFQCPWVQVEEP